MPVLVAQGLQRSYGPREVLADVSLALEPGERVALVGVNGSGKSTLARILSGLEVPDGGSVVLRNDARIAILAQEPQFKEGATAIEAALEGLADWREAMNAHERASEALSTGDDFEKWLEVQAQAGADIERLGGWSRESEAESMLQQLQAPPADRLVSTMSGGERRRVALARALVSKADFLVLDEPTNHLDVETIEWLEGHLQDPAAQPGAVLCITHDRYFLDRIATRTIELEYGVVHSFVGGFTAYLEGKAEREAHDDRVEKNRQNFIRRELAWLRRGPKARSTKQKARIDRAESVIGASGPKKRGDVKLHAAVARSGRTLLSLDKVSIDLGERRLVNELTFTLNKGDCVGIVGPNGAGKSTLISAMLGTAVEDAIIGGDVRQGETLKVVSLDQKRSGLDLNKSIVDNVSEGGRVDFQGQSLDARTYLERFLFEYKEQDRPVETLSGGERVRVLLAKLLLQPMNLLVLDEPTNDLDLHTLSALESMIGDLKATVLLVTHDRWMLDRLATQVLCFEGEGQVTAYAGGYTDLLAQRAKTPAPASVAPPAPKKSKKKKGSGRGRPKFGAKEQSELDGMAAAIEAAEAESEALGLALAEGATSGEAHEKAMTAYEKSVAKVETLMARWETLEELRAEADD